MKSLLCVLFWMFAGPLAWSAATVYRCGAASSPVYQQEPCAGGKTVSVADPRSAAQKAEAEAAARSQARTADRMEKERLAKEAEMLRASQPKPAANTAKAPRPKASAPKAKGSEKLPVYIPFKPATK
jgi:hypothetical protein